MSDEYNFFNVPPPKKLKSYDTIILHIDALWRGLNKLERQVLALQHPWDLEEVLNGLREKWAWLNEEIKEAVANEQWADDKAMEAYYGKEFMAEVYRKREEKRAERERSKCPPPGEAAE